MNLATMRAARLGLAALLGVVSAARAAEVPTGSPTLKDVMARGELRVGLEAGYIPFEMRNKQSEIVGFDVDLAKLMARALKVRVAFVNTQWDGIIPALLTDKFDILMSGMTITDERAKQVDFAPPYLVIGQTLLLNRKLAGEVHGYQDLNQPKYTIATKIGTTGEIAARQTFSRATVRTFETEADGALEVRNGRADAFCYDLPFNTVYAAQYPDALEHLKEPFTREPLGWAIRKNDPAFLAWLGDFLAGIKADGRYEALRRKWFDHTTWLANVTGAPGQPEVPATAAAPAAAPGAP